MEAGPPDRASLATICISSHNYERFLGEAIDSALAQDYPHVEVIVIDDASTDGSRAVIASYGDRIRACFHETKCGHNSTINAGVAMARGDLFFLLDADDVFLPAKVGRIMELYRRQPSAALFYHRLPNGNADLSEVGAGRSVTLQGDLRARILHAHGRWPYMPTSSMAFPRRILEHVLPLPTTKSGSDPDFILSVLTPLFGDVVVLDEALAIRRLHDSNMYAHAERLARREWTLRDNISRTIDGLGFANAILERIGENVSYEPERHSWVIQMYYQLGEASDFELIWSYLRLRRWLGTLPAVRSAFWAWRESRAIRRRIRRHKLKHETS